MKPFKPSILVFGCLILFSFGKIAAQDQIKLNTIDNHYYVLTQQSPAGGEYIAFAYNETVLISPETILNIPEAVIQIKPDTIENSKMYFIYFVNTKEYLYNGIVKVSQDQFDKAFAKDANAHFIKPEIYRTFFRTKIQIHPDGKISFGNAPQKFKLYLIKE